MEILSATKDSVIVRVQQMTKTALWMQEKGWHLLDTVIDDDHVIMCFGKGEFYKERLNAISN